LFSLNFFKEHKRGARHPFLIFYYLYFKSIYLIFNISQCLNITQIYLLCQENFKILFKLFIYTNKKSCQVFF